MDKINVAVFFGGDSPEHEISILTGIQSFHAFDTKKYTPLAVYVTREGLLYIGDNLVDTKEYKDIDVLLAKSNLAQIEKTKEGIFLVSKKILGIKRIKIDVAFLAFHGGIGEGGSFQGYCETLGLPYTGSDVLGSALCMDKVSMKKILEKAHIPVSDYFVAHEQEFLLDQKSLIQKIEKTYPYPLFIKPSNGGSSIGVSRAQNSEELELALELAFSFDTKVLIEQEFEHDAEVNISCLGLWNKSLQLSTTEEVYSDAEFLDFENKYLKGAKSKKATVSTGSKGMASTSRQVPARITDAMKQRIETYAQEAFRVLNCGGVARLDFLVNKKNNSLVLIEVNTIPGSLAYYLWEASEKPFNDLIDDMIKLALERQSEKTRHARKFTSHIFKNL
jgi:D-alanine-D-alanine ligase